MTVEMIKCTEGLTIELTAEERTLLRNAMSILIYNGNHVEEEQMAVTPEVYKVACKVFNKVK